VTADSAFGYLINVKEIKANVNINRMFWGIEGHHKKKE
jgi:hypothetical protein